jgi:transcriptional regulator GlxA family with amidase domain
MLRAPDARVLDVAVTCGFKTQQHFAQVFRDAWGVSPTEYRRDLAGAEPEPHSHGLPFTSLWKSSPVRNL